MNTTRSKGMYVCVAMLVMGLGIVGIAPAAFSAAAKGTYEETIERQLPFNPGASLSLEGRNGHVVISVWDQDEIKIIGKKRMKIERVSSWFARLIGLKVPDIESDEDAREYLEQFTMDISGDADGLEVKTLRPASAGHLQFTMSYEIVLPRESDVSVEMTNGRIEITGVSGSVGAKTVNGRVIFNEITGPVEARTTNGRIEFDGLTGGIEARTVNGRIEGSLAALPSSDAEITCRTTNGGIRLGVPRDANFEFEIETRSSHVSSDFELTSSTADRRKRMEGIVGDGGPLISLRTTNGPVELEAL